MGLFTKTVPNPVLNLKDQTGSVFSTPESFNILL